MQGKSPGVPKRRWGRLSLLLAAVVSITLGFAPGALASEGMGEASLVLPSLGDVSFHGISGSLLLALGLIFCALGLIFGLVVFYQLRKMPAHRSMREISELIWQSRYSSHCVQSV